MKRKDHWNNIYSTKEHDSVSWYQPEPTTSLKAIDKFQIPLDAKIIDIGGGQSFLVDNLLKLGYKNVTVLDISKEAIQKTKDRLGELAHNVQWIVSDILDYEFTEKYDFWHDRATFHFLNTQSDIAAYQQQIKKGLNHNGIAFIGTFSIDGPTKCSGIEITQYDEHGLPDKFNFFEKIECFRENHTTPSEKNQNFIFCTFKNI
ncbi:Methyltransferase domain-containing protein [Zhouia amylolytica]|uniref:Methyltransferase domain-containing protein n=1 Tax=Zhouia amylolytica TaxID=376730 RepID=A0A1I6RLQ6_9FLAO|nr:class I SAM-dependent methyltransferase [Zhouia amylolytica]SFS65647.1 Methyltransferase domain-containing protein [Zhouia amylolytica]